MNLAKILQNNAIVARPRQSPSQGLRNGEFLTRLSPRQTHVDAQVAPKPLRLVSVGNPRQYPVSD